jgi:hypothetical protein
MESTAGTKMQIFNKTTSFDPSKQIDSLVISKKLIEYVALKAGIPALGLWVLLCNQVSTSKLTQAAFCQSYGLPESAFEKTMNKLAGLNLAWHEQDQGFQTDWCVSNLPQTLTKQTESFLFQLNAFFAQDDLANESFDGKRLANVVTEEPRAIVNNANLSTDYHWDTLVLQQDFHDVASTKIPKELVQQYWDSFTSSNDNKGEMVPSRSVLFKKWKSYIANVSVNLAVSDRRFTNNIERKKQSISLTEQKNIAAWQALLEHKIPQIQSYSAMMSNLSTVENDVWLGFIQQNIRFKNSLMNNTTLQYAFEEYCKTTGQKFLKQKASAPSEFDDTLNDTSWANNLDDVL